ncbi:MAG: hypothetical protein ACTSVY_14160 [Candidatus Helarchaeota archaeon]
MNLFNDFKIETECPISIDNDIVTMESTRSDENSPHKCVFVLQKEIKSRDDKVKIKFKIQMNFDPDGSRLEILIDSNKLKNFEFVELLKNVRHQQWGKITLKLEDEQIKGKHLISLKFDTFHGDDPFKLKLKDIKIG